MSPRLPRFASPLFRSCPKKFYAAQKKAFESGSLSAESYVPGQTGTRPNTSAEKAWSEYNHHWQHRRSGDGLLALIAQAGQISWAPQLAASLLRALGISFLSQRSGDLPLGPSASGRLLGSGSTAASFFSTVLVIDAGDFRMRVQTGRVASGVHG